MDLRASSPKVAFDYDGNAVISFAIDKKYVCTLKSEYDKIKDRDLRLEVKQWRERRSLDANAYAWLLISKIAEALTVEGQAYTKDEIYLIMLKRYGQGGIVKVRKDASEMFTRLNMYCEVHERLFDENAVYYKFWVGSSNYDTKEMSLLIHGIVDEAQALGVETITPEEIASLLSLWGK